LQKPSSTTKRGSDELKAALDVTDIYASSKGKRIINAIYASTGQLVVSKRGRHIMLIRADVADKLREQMGFSLAYGDDGAALVIVEPDAPSPPEHATAQ